MKKKVCKYCKGKFLYEFKKLLRTEVAGGIRGPKFHHRPKRKDILVKRHFQLSFCSDQCMRLYKRVRVSPFDHVMGVLRKGTVKLLGMFTIGEGLK